MSKGKVKEYDLKRGYGTIVDFDTGKQLSVYANYVLLKEGEFLKEAQDVEYDIETTRHSSWAINVRII
jgi:cold shock CspA family protein